MADTIKVLGQLDPGPALSTLYTAPSSATVSSLVVCNQTASPVQFRVSVAVAGAADASKQYLYYDLDLEANDTFAATIGITLADTDVVRCYASVSGVSFTLYGVETTESVTKVLAQTHGDVGLTNLYTVPGSKMTVVSSVVCSNRSATATTFYLSVAVAGAADNAKQYLYYNISLDPNDSFVAVLGFTLATTDVIRVNAVNSNIAFTLFGEETAAAAAGDTIKVLGQLSSALTTLETLYTVPAATKTAISSFIVSNGFAVEQTFRLAIRVAGAAITGSQYLYYDMTIPPYDSFAGSLGITLDATDVVSVYSSVAALAFNLFGVEIPNTSDEDYTLYTQLDRSTEGTGTSTLLSTASNVVFMLVVCNRNPFPITFTLDLAIYKDLYVEANDTFVVTEAMVYAASSTFNVTSCVRADSAQAGTWDGVSFNLFGVSYVSTDTFVRSAWDIASGGGVVEIYISPNDKQSVVNSIQVCNNGATSQTFSIYEAISGEATALKQALYYNEEVLGGDSFEICIGITHDQNDTLRAENTGASGTLTFYVSATESPRSDNHDTYKVLGQAEMTAATATLLYTAPTGLGTVISSFTACNSTGSEKTFRLSIRVAGAADSSKQYLYYDMTVPAYDTFVGLLGLTLASTDLVYGYTTEAGISFNLFGTEVN